MKRRGELLFVDASAGASGDMILGALVDVGVPATHLRRALQTLPVEGWTLRARKVTRCGLAARKVDVRARREEHGRTWRSLKRIVESGSLEPSVRRRALAIFRRLIEAEAEAHGAAPDRVHLHEAGAVDAIVDVVGAAVGLEYLGVSRIRVSPMTTGFGSVRCAHGIYPVPGPATLRLVRGFPIQAGDIEVERLTPTGAAILTTIADEWGEMPPFRPASTGYGAGDRDLGETPNLLRMIVGDAARPASRPEHLGVVAVLECTMDDSTPETLAYAAARLLEGGALDVTTTAVTMKKGRSGHHLTVLTRPERMSGLARTLLRETSSLGLRYRTEQRIELARRVAPVRTPFGRVRVTVGELDGDVVQVNPEYDDCADAARKHDVPLKDVQRAALRAFRSARRPRGGNR